MVCIDNLRVVISVIFLRCSLFLNECPNLIILNIYWILMCLIFLYKISFVMFSTHCLILLLIQIIWVVLKKEICVFILLACLSGSYVTMYHLINIFSKKDIFFILKILKISFPLTFWKKKSSDFSKGIIFQQTSYY